MIKDMKLDFTAVLEQLSARLDQLNEAGALSLMCDVVLDPGLGGRGIHY